MLTFDENNLRETAEVVIRINPHLEGFEVDQVMRMMRRDAENCYDENNNFGYLSTFGYVLTLYTGSNDKPAIKASVNSYTVMTFLADNRYRLKKVA